MDGTNAGWVQLPASCPFFPSSLAGAVSGMDGGRRVRCTERLMRLSDALSAAAPRHADAAGAPAPTRAAPPSESFRVDTKTVDSFWRQGAVLIKGLLSDAQVERLQEGIDENMASPGAFGAVASREDDPGEFFEDFCNWNRIPAFQDIIFGTAIPRVAAQLMRSATVRLFHDHL